MGAYDEDEHERRERKNSEVDLSEADDRGSYRGEVEYESAGSTEELLDQFREMQSS